MAGETVPAKTPKEGWPTTVRWSPDAGVEIGAGAANRARVIEVNEKPAAGQVLVLEASSQEIIRILFGIDGATVKEADGNLYVSFQDGGVIVIKGATIASCAQAPTRRRTGRRPRPRCPTQKVLSSLISPALDSAS